MSTRCNTPYQDKDGIKFPCGKCFGCRRRRVSGWSFRLMKEAERSSSAFFLTLTYDEQNVPLTENGFMTLEPGHITAFMKALRKKQKPGVSLKYYAVGEYGSQYSRPHYHILLFNAELGTLVQPKVAYQMILGNIPIDGKYHAICDSWNKGFVSVGQLTPASVGYTLEYISKGRIVPAHNRDDRAQEFSRMSKGIGSNYVNDDTYYHHKRDKLNNMFITLKDGVKIAMPRYIKDKIYTPQDKEEINNHLSQKAWQERVEKSMDELEQEQRILNYERSKNNKDTRRGRGGAERAKF